MGCLSGWGWEGIVKLFKQISKKYQSPRTRQETLLVCSLAAEAFVPRRETILSMLGRQEVKTRDS